MSAIMEKKKNIDPETIVTTLGNKVPDVKEKDAPKLLLQLGDVIEKLKGTGRAYLKIKQDVWSYNLLYELSLSMKQDFSKVEGQWNTAAKLASILSSLAIGLDPDEDKEDFYDHFLPSATENILELAKKFQNRYDKTAEILEDRKMGYLQNFKSVMESLITLLSGHSFLAVNVVQSPVFSQLLMTEDSEMTLIVLSALQSANRMKQGVFETLGLKRLRSLLDEVIYKLSDTSEEKIASSATRTLLMICDSHPPTLDLLCRYGGLLPLLSKWSDAGFGRDLRRLKALLEAGSYQQAALEKHDRAAQVIQAWWKSIYTRRKLKRANTAMAKLQRSFRSRKDNEQRLKEEEKQRQELQHMLQLRRKRAMRELHQKRLQTIEILPPAEVDKHLRKEQSRAALIIQRTYRGHRSRKTVERSRREAERMKAAMTIQRAVRRWIRKVEKKRREPPNWQRPPGLTDTRRVELQEHITVWRDNHVTQAKTEEERTRLHEKVQGMLKRDAMVSRATRRNHQHRETLLAQLDVDSTMLLGAPKLSEISEADAAAYTSYSVPITSRARYNHHQELRLLRQPWWKKLGDMYQDEKLEEELSWKVF